MARIIYQTEFDREDLDEMGQECYECGGYGEIEDDDGDWVGCPECGGYGLVD